MEGEWTEILSNCQQKLFHYRELTKETDQAR